MLEGDSLIFDVVYVKGVNGNSFVIRFLVYLILEKIINFGFFCFRERVFVFLLLKIEIEIIS